MVEGEDPHAASDGVEFAPFMKGPVTSSHAVANGWIEKLILKLANPSPV